MSKNDCSICMQEMEDLTMVTTSCCHQFHDACLKEWFKKHTNCPICRNEIEVHTKTIAIEKPDNDGMPAYQYRMVYTPQTTFSVGGNWIKYEIDLSNCPNFIDITQSYIRIPINTILSSPSEAMSQPPPDYFQTTYTDDYEVKYAFN